jgi:hypothetical protein
MKKTDQMRYWLACHDYTASELAAEVGCNVAHAWRFLREQYQKGNVEIAFRKAGNSSSYVWCADDDLVVTAVRAADYLRANAADERGQQIATRIYALASAA